MTVISRVLQQLERGDPVTSSMIADLINDHKVPRERMVGLFNRYKTDATQIWYSPSGTTTIFRRKFEDTTKVNNQINVDHFSNIVNTKTGYFVGEPIIYSVDEDAPNKDLIEGKIKEFNQRIDSVDLDTETGKMASICGYGARLYFINTEGKEDALNVPPWEAIFLSDEGDVTKPKYAIRYYTTTELTPEGRSREVVKVEWYDSQNITYWTEAAPDPVAPGTQDPNTVQKVPSTVYRFQLEKESTPHMFTEVPLIGFPNNEELQGDAEKVLALIDAYDRTISDQNSEIEQFRMAYLAIYGYANIDDKFIAQLKKTGVIGFDNPEDKAEFITKQIDATLIENHLNRLEQEIYAISGIPNLRDEEFSGNSSGVALKFKLFPMEVKCKMAENKFSAALHQQFKIVGSKWQIEDVKFNSDDLKFTFKRNFPLNLLDVAQTAQALKGIISDETLLGLLPFVKNPLEELDRMKKEREDQIDLDKVPIDDQNPEMEESENGMQRQGQEAEEVTGPAKTSS